MLSYLKIFHRTPRLALVVRVNAQTPLELDTSALPASTYSTPGII
jgi:hypothetical protein